MPVVWRIEHGEHLHGPVQGTWACNCHGEGSAGGRRGPCPVFDCDVPRVCGWRFAAPGPRWLREWFSAGDVVENAAHGYRLRAYVVPDVACLTLLTYHLRRVSPEFFPQCQFDAEWAERVLDLDPRDLWSREPAELVAEVTHVMGD